MIIHSRQDIFPNMHPLRAIGAFILVWSVNTFHLLNQTDAPEDRSERVAIYQVSLVPAVGAFLLAL